MPRDKLIQIRRGTAAQWADADAASAADPSRLLADGEPGYDTTNDVYKIGDGISQWADLVGFVSKTAVDAVGTLAASAKSMAVRGFSPKTSPVQTMWAFPGIGGNGFTSAGTSGGTFTLEDTSTFALGDRSAKMKAADAANSWCRVSKTGLSIDATGQFVRVWFKVDDISKLNGPVQVFLSDSAFANYFVGDVFKPTAYQSLRASNVLSGQWTMLDIPWSSFTVGAGTPSRSTITTVALYTSGQASGSATVWLGGIAGVAERSSYPNGVVSLTFDDTFIDSYTIARPYMDKYAYAGTLYPIQGLFGQAGRLTEQQATDLYRINGWDFGYHATTQAAHDAAFDTLTEDQLVTEFETQRAWASQRGIVGDSFAWPIGYLSALAETVAARYYRTARLNVAHEPEVLPPSMPMRVRSIPGNASNTLATMTGFVDKIKAGKGWGVFTFHQLVASGAAGNQMTIADFQSLVDYIHAQGVPVQTVTQVMDRI